MRSVSEILSSVVVLVGLCLPVSFAVAAPKTKKASPAVTSAEIVEYRSRLESMITAKYRDRISTQIPTEAFNVGTNVTVEISEDVGPAAASRSTEDIPSDISLGIVESFVPEVATSVKSNLKIKKVEILVGLHPKLGSEYKTKFSGWLKTLVSSEFGAIGVAKVDDMAPNPPVKKEPEVARPLNWEERFGYFQNAIGLGLLALFILVGIILVKRIPSRDAQEQVSVALQIQQMRNSQLQLSAGKLPGMGAALEKSKSEVQLSANLLFDNYRDHQKKVAFIVFSDPNKMDLALDIWFDEGDEGRRKIASLVDSAVTQYGIAQLDQSVTAPGQMSWAIPEKIRNDKNLPQVFRDFASLSLADKTMTLEKAYWDLLSLQTLSDKLMRPKFASVAQLPAAKIKKILGGQDQKVKSLTLLHLPAEKLTQIMDEMSFDDKKSTVLQAFEITRVREKEIDLLDESLKFHVKKEEDEQEGAVEVQSLIPNLLMSLKPNEEIKLLQEIVPKLTDKGEFLKQNYPSMAFLVEWPDDKLKLIVTNAPMQEILCLLQALPEASSKVMAVLPSRTKTILQDEIGKKQFDTTELNQHLENVKYRLFKAVNDGQVSLSQIFKPSDVAARKVA